MVQHIYTSRQKPPILKVKVKHMFYTSYTYIYIYIYIYMFVCVCMYVYILYIIYLVTPLYIEAPLEKPLLFLKKNNNVKQNYTYITLKTFI